MSWAGVIHEESSPGKQCLATLSAEDGTKANGFA